MSSLTFMRSLVICGIVLGCGQRAAVAMQQPSENDVMDFARDLKSLDKICVSILDGIWVDYVDRYVRFNSADYQALMDELKGFDSKYKDIDYDACVSQAYNSDDISWDQLMFFAGADDADFAVLNLVSSGKLQAGKDNSLFVAATDHSDSRLSKIQKACYQVVEQTMGRKMGFLMHRNRVPLFGLFGLACVIVANT